MTLPGLTDIIDIMDELTSVPSAPLLVQSKVNPAILEELNRGYTVDDLTIKHLTSLFSTIQRVFGTQVGASISPNNWNRGIVDIHLNYADPVFPNTDDTILTLRARALTEYDPFGVSGTFNLKSAIFSQAYNGRTWSAADNLHYRSAMSLRACDNILSHYRKRLNHYINRNDLKRGQVPRYAGLVEAKAFAIYHASRNTRSRTVPAPPQLDGMHYDARLIKAGLPNDHALWFAVNKVPGNIVNMFAGAPLEWVKEIVGDNNNK